MTPSFPDDFQQHHRGSPVTPAELRTMLEALRDRWVIVDPMRSVLVYKTLDAEDDEERFLSYVTAAAHWEAVVRPGGLVEPQEVAVGRAFSGPLPDVEPVVQISPENALAVSLESIQGFIASVLEGISGEDFYYTGSGDSFVIALNAHPDVRILVFRQSTQGCLYLS